MTDVEDLKLKAEIDEIMESVDNIMQKVETVIPAKPEVRAGIQSKILHLWYVMWQCNS